MCYSLESEHSPLPSHTRSLLATLRFLTFLGLFFDASSIKAQPRVASTESPAVTPAVTPAALSDLLDQSCLHCHEGDSAEGGLDLASLSSNLGDPNTAAKWVRIHDRVRDGEMPPPDEEELTSTDHDRFVTQSSKWISDSETLEHRTLGRVRGRRLSHVQLERTLQELLGIAVPLASYLPPEPRVNGFDGIANAQSMSHYQVESHLRVVDRALDAAFDRLTQSDSTWQRELTPQAVCSARRKRRRCREPEMRQGAAVVWSSTLPFYGRIAPTRVPESGWYRITISATALNSPNEHGVWCTLRSGPCQSTAPLLNDIGSFEADGQRKTRTYEAWIEEGHLLEVRPADSTLKRGRFKGGQVETGVGDPMNVPGVAIHALTIQRIFPGGDRESVHQKLLGDLKVSVSNKGRSLILHSKKPTQETLKQLRGFTRRAFRRPVSEAEAKPYVQMLRRSMASGVPPVVALRSAYRAVLCSPRFLYFVEPITTPTQSDALSDGALDSFAIANRLSYLLTSSSPDTRLIQLARAGKLDDQVVLRQQVDRLLKGQSGRDFADDFTSQWLDLINIDFTEPDRRMFGKFDPVVKNAMVQETQLFFHALVANNAPVERLIKADFSFLNSRLARFYELDLDVGEEMSRVKLPVGCVRGGLLSQGAVLKVTANGTTTSPVLRGVWVSERILGIPIPPPPESVPAVEPDIRGAVTIREQLLKHVAHDACETCHKNIDPPGYALENFDPAGQWRERYYYRNAKRGKKRPRIDSSFTMRDGEKFETFNEFRNLISRDPDSLARNFAAQLLVYGTGAEIGFTDRETLDTIVRQTKNDNHGLRDIIKAVVSHPTFRSK